MSTEQLPDLYDHEIVAIDEVMRKLQDKQGTFTSMEGFRKEAIGRFAEIGFVVDVKVWETDEPGTYAVDLDITGRCEPQEGFDHERQQWEVREDVLGIDPSMKGETIKPKEHMEDIRKRQGGHSH